ASPALRTFPNPNTVALGPNAATLTDTALLVNGYNSTGTITLTLVAPSGGTVDTEMVPVNGNGLYRTPSGFTLPSSGAETRPYQWNAVYSGDSNNHGASDVSQVSEQVTVTTASPTLTTNPTPATIPLGTTSVTLKDTADLEDDYNPMGTITFT